MYPHFYRCNRPIKVRIRRHWCCIHSAHIQIAHWVGFVNKASSEVDRYRFAGELNMTEVYSKRHKKNAGPYFIY